MIRTSMRWVVFIVFALPTATPSVLAQSLDTPMTRLRPLGAPSAVDQFLAPANAPSYRETAYQTGAAQTGAAQTGAAQTGVATRQFGGSYDSGVRQTALLQQFVAPQLPGVTQPPGNFTPPPTPAPPSVIPTQPQTMAPRVLPAVPGTFAPVPMDPSGRIPSNADLAPLAQPQLNGGFATIDNCSCVSPPSSYVSATPWGPCAPVSYQAPQTYVTPPAQIVAPSFVPVVPVTGKGTGVPRGALISFGQERNPVQVGQGIIGQPVAYVPGQRIRNWVRYFFP